MAKRSAGEPSVKRKREPVVYSKLDYVALVDIARKSKDEVKARFAFEEIVRRMEGLMRQMSYHFDIPGNQPQDTYQEALIALRFKAIKDYDKNRGDKERGPYPFEKFAKLCIVRHLSTKLKASYQNKKKAWIKMVPYDKADQDGDETLSLIDIQPGKGASSILEAIAKDEQSRVMFRKLFEKLSDFEQEVLKHYLRKNSYDTICDKINLILPKKEQIRVKSVDNALSRVKNKARIVRDKYGD